MIGAVGDVVAIALVGAGVALALETAWACRWADLAGSILAIALGATWLS